MAVTHGTHWQVCRWRIFCQSLLFNSSLLFILLLPVLFTIFVSSFYPYIPADWLRNTCKLMQAPASSCYLMHLLAGLINNTSERAKGKYAVWCDTDFIRFQVSDRIAWSIRISPIYLPYHMSITCLAVSHVYHMSCFSPIYWPYHMSCLRSVRPCITSAYECLLHYKCLAP